MIYIDDGPNADWIKTVSWEYPTDAEQFLMFIGGAEHLEHFMTLPVAEQMPDGLRVELAMRTGVKIPFGKRWDPALHPRDNQGQFAEVEGLATPDNTDDLRAEWRHGSRRFYHAVAAHGGTPVEDQDSAYDYRHHHIAEAKPEDVAPDDRERCEAAAKEWFNNRAMQDEFSAYGRPSLVVASRLVGVGEGVGDDPAELSVAAQWVGGMIFMYGNVAGRDDVKAEPGFSIGENELQATLTHEYGHQVFYVAGTEEGTLNEFGEAFHDALSSSATSSSPQERADSFQMHAEQVSTYAARGGLAEAFAEFFAALHQPDFDIEDYDGGAREAFELIQQRIADDVAKARGNPNQGELF